MKTPPSLSRSTYRIRLVKDEIVFRVGFAQFRDPPQHTAQRAVATVSTTIAAAFCFLLINKLLSLTLIDACASRARRSSSEGEHRITVP
jgi:hypothetical protein